MDEQLSIFETQATEQNKTTPRVVNVASVPQRSPFRYPGGKTWLIPVVRKWLKSVHRNGGIITKGSGLIKNGENGKGIKSRWYPKTLRDRIMAVGYVKSKMNFVTGDGFEVLEKTKNDEDAYSFIDPPYTVAGKRLYTHFKIDHDALFALAAQLKGKFMLTYDDTKEIRELANKYNLDSRTIPMKTTHHIQKNEIIISDNFDWWD